MADRERLLDTWLSVARALLRRALALVDDRGALAVLCGIDETSYVRLLLDELAGPQNHLGTVAWQKGYSPRNMPGMRELSPVHDNVVLYARRIETLPPVSLRLPAEGFSNKDHDPRGAWKAEQKGANKPDCDYEVNVCPYRWELTNGELPPGIWRINPKTGVIWGKPEKSGVWHFTIRVSDSSGATAEKSFSLEVADGVAPPAKPSIPWLIVTRDEAGNVANGARRGGPLRITTAELPTAGRGSAYSACILATGGHPWIGTTRPGKTSKGGKGRYWEFPASTLLARTFEDSVDFKTRDDAIPALKVYADGQDKRLNQTTLWFGRARSNSDADDPTDVDYSQDAKKELSALEEAGVISRIVPAAKPAKLMMRLLALFTNDEATVVDIGSPAAEMASVATAAGRRAVYVAAPPNEEVAEAVWIPRLRLAARGSHPLPSNAVFSRNRTEGDTGYIIDGAPQIETENGDVFILRPGDRFAEVDRQVHSVQIDYSIYPSGSAAFLNALASVEGLVPLPGDTSQRFAQSRDGRIKAFYVSAKDWMERSFIDEISQANIDHLNARGIIRIYYHRGFGDSDKIADRRIDVRRIPFDLTLAAGIA